MKKLIVISLLLSGCSLLKPKAPQEKKTVIKKDRLDRNTDCVLKLMAGDALPLNAGKICNDIFKR